MRSNLTGKNSFQEKVNFFKEFYHILWTRNICWAKCWYWAERVVLLQRNSTKTGAVGNSENNSIFDFLAIKCLCNWVTHVAYIPSTTALKVTRIKVFNSNKEVRCSLSVRKDLHLPQLTCSLTSQSHESSCDGSTVEKCMFLKDVKIFCTSC